jgi:hypothetical protein
MSGFCVECNHSMASLAGDDFASRYCTTCRHDTGRMFKRLVMHLRPTDFEELIIAAPLPGHNVVRVRSSRHYSVAFGIAPSLALALAECCTRLESFHARHRSQETHP